MFLIPRPPSISETTETYGSNVNWGELLEALLKALLNALSATPIDFILTSTKKKLVIA